MSFIALGGSRIPSSHTRQAGGLGDGGSGRSNEGLTPTPPLAQLDWAVPLAVAHGDTRVLQPKVNADTHSLHPMLRH